MCVCVSQHTRFTHQTRYSTATTKYLLIMLIIWMFDTMFLLLYDNVGVSLMLQVISEAGRDRTWTIVEKFTLLHFFISHY